MTSYTHGFMHIQTREKNSLWALRKRLGNGAVADNSSKRHPVAKRFPNCDNIWAHPVELAGPHSSQAAETRLDLVSNAHAPHGPDGSVCPLIELARRDKVTGDTQRRLCEEETDFTAELADLFDCQGR
jgi:hypothetical protein